jgi:hypothetical protein
LIYIRLSQVIGECILIVDPCVICQVWISFLDAV